MKKIMFVLCLIAMLVTVSAVTQAAVVNTVDFWFATDAIGTPVSSLDVLEGADFDVSVWYQTSDSWSHSSMEILAGWSKTATRGTTAVAGDNMISNRNGAVGFSDVMTSGWNAPTKNEVGGGKSADNNPGSYGSHLTLTWATSGQTTTQTVAKKIATLNLTNLNIPAGASYTMKLWRAASPATQGWSCYLGQTGNQNQEAVATELTINSTAVPEPTSMIALGSGVLGLLGFLRRRRS